MKFNKKTVFIALFAVLYLCVGLVSTIHAVSFFGLANAPLLGIILAVTFEVGQAAVLFNLLTSPSQRKKFMPWALMCILTLVQILGNIFSSYKYLITNSTQDLRYFKEPIFTWTDLPDEQCNVIITYIVGAILPIVALCLTEMVVSYLGSEAEQELNAVLDEQPEHKDEPIFTPEDIQKVNDKLVDETKNERVKTPQETLEKLMTMKDENGNPFFNPEFLAQKFGIYQPVKVENIENENEQLNETEQEKEQETEQENEQETEQEKEQEITEKIEQEISQSEVTDKEENFEDIKNENPIEITPETTEAVNELLQGPIKQDGIKPLKSSHFINI